MCTVSFVPVNGSFVITSNRDESIARPAALFPKQYNLNGIDLLFPMDPLRGGTWFVINQKGDVLVLLNGAGERHISDPPYRLSRGLILVDLASAANVKSSWSNLNLNNIEPFTLILFSGNELFQLRWNGKEKTEIRPDSNYPHIWSSVMLYSPETINLRKQWFDSFISSNKISEHTILEFHRFKESEDKENGLVVKRENGVVTQSVCQAVLGGEQVKMNYMDLLTGNSSLVYF